MHCWLDRLGKATLFLVALLGMLYASAYMFGWPDLPDPDRSHREHMRRMACERRDIYSPEQQP